MSCTSFSTPPLPLIYLRYQRHRLFVWVIWKSCSDYGKVGSLWKREPGWQRTSCNYVSQLLIFWQHSLSGRKSCESQREWAISLVLNRDQWLVNHKNGFLSLFNTSFYLFHCSDSGLSLILSFGNSLTRGVIKLLPWLAWSLFHQILDILL